MANGGAVLRGRLGKYCIVRPLTRDHRVVLASDDDGGVAVIKRCKGGIPQAAALLRREASILGELDGLDGKAPKLLTSDLGADPPWFAMQFVRGPTLSQALDDLHVDADDRAAPSAQQLMIMSGLARALDAVHQRGVVHGDLTPTNVILRDGVVPVLIDFGCAFHDEVLTSSWERIRDGLPAFGTVGYVAPEVGPGFPGDARSDLYSLGRTFVRVVGARSDEPASVAALGEQGVLHQVLALIRSLLEDQPNARPPNAAAVSATLTGIRQERVRVHRSHAKPVAKRARLVGREAAVATLRSAMLAASESRGGALLCLGEAGLGKTRLLNEAITLGAERGFEVLLARCGEHHDGRPAIVGALERHLSVEQLALVHRLGSAEPPVAQNESTRQLPPPVEGLRPQALQILLDALFLASERAPQLLLIDDLQLADELSTSFVRSPRLERLGQHRVCIIAASRTETDSPLGHRPLAGWEPLVLPRLDTDQTRLVLSDVLGAFTPSLEDWLYQRTEGNPLYLIEYVRRLVESTVLAFDAGQEKWRLTKQETSLPESLNELIDGRLASVGTAAKRVAAVVASLTTPFTLQSAQQAVAAVWGMSASQCELSLVELCAARILLRAGTEYRYSHVLYRQRAGHLAVGIPSRELSTRLARHYATKSASSERDTIIGLLWADAGDPARALDYLVPSADSARARHHNATARRLYSRALEQLELLPQDELQSRAPLHSRIHTALADLLHVEAHWEEADFHYRRAIETLTAATPLELAWLWQKRARTSRVAHQYEHAYQALRLAEEHLQQAERRTSEWWEAWFEVKLTWFWAYYYARRDPSELLAALEKALPHATKAQQCSYYQACCGAELTRSRYRGTQRAVASALRALRLIDEEAALSVRRPEAQMVAGFALMWADPPDCRGAIPQLEEAVRGALHLDDLALLSQARVYLALAHRRAGDVDAADEVSSRAYLTAQRSGSAGYMGAAQATRAWVAWKRGRERDALRAVESARGHWADGKLRHPFQCFLNLVWLDLCRLREQFSRAQELCGELLRQDQHLLPSPLVDTIVEAQDAPTADRRSIDLALAHVVEIARRHQYV